MYARVWGKHLGKRSAEKEADEPVRKIAGLNDEDIEELAEEAGIGGEEKEIRKRANLVRAGKTPAAEKVEVGRRRETEEIRKLQQDVAELQRAKTAAENKTRAAEEKVKKAEEETARSADSAHRYHEAYVQIQEEERKSRAEVLALKSAAQQKDSKVKQLEDRAKRAEKRAKDLAAGKKEQCPECPKCAKGVRHGESVALLAVKDISTEAAAEPSAAAGSIRAGGRVRVQTKTTTDAEYKAARAREAWNSTKKTQ